VYLTVTIRIAMLSLQTIIINQVNSSSQIIIYFLFFSKKKLLSSLKESSIYTYKILDKSNCIVDDVLKVFSKSIFW
jgi:hypothetical protein